MLTLLLGQNVPNTRGLEWMLVYSSMKEELKIILHAD